MKNKKGFTLIELLVCITILGIIMGMSIPVIRNITVKNSATKYSSYLDTVVHAAKLYIDSYGEDIFGYNESGCGYVSFEDLLDHNLIKDYNADGITCNTNSTFVEVTKYEDSYSYKGYLGCANKHDVNNLIYTLPNNGEENVQDSVTCAGVDSTTTLNVSVSPNGYDFVDKNYMDVKLHINGRSGIAREFDLMYKWTTDSTDLTTTGMQRATFNVPTEASQRLVLEGGNVVTATSSEISTPYGETGDVYLIVQSFNLRDLYGVTWLNNNSNYAVFGPFKIDSTPPVFDYTSTVVSSNSLYNCDKPRLSLKVTDNMSQTSDMKMCISYDGHCYDWEPYDPVKVLPAIPDFQYDGSSYTVYVTISDAADNYAMQQFTYKSYVKCSSMEPVGEFPGCPACGNSTKITVERERKDVYLGVSCPTEKKSITCSGLKSCCYKPTMVCSEWSEYSECSRLCGGGTSTRTRTCKNYSQYDGSFCGDVTNTKDISESIACNKITCSPTLCYEGNNSWSSGSDIFYYTKYECANPVEYTKYALERNCSVKYPTTGQNARCISSVTYTIDGVKPETYIKLGNGSWNTDIFDGWDPFGKYDMYLQSRSGKNYSVKGPTAYYKINK